MDQEEVTVLDAPITYVTKEILTKISTLETPATNNFFLLAKGFIEWTVKPSFLSCVISLG